MTTKEMLERRHELKLGWIEPWPACGPEGNDLSSHVEMRATVHDCVNMNRLSYRQKGFSTTGNDEQHLLDFIAVNWATPVK